MKPEEFLNSPEVFAQPEALKIKSRSFQFTVLGRTFIFSTFVEKGKAPSLFDKIDPCVSDHQHAWVCSLQEERERRQTAAVKSVSITEPWKCYVCDHPQSIFETMIMYQKEKFCADCFSKLQRAIRNTREAEATGNPHPFSKLDSADFLLRFKINYNRTHPQIPTQDVSNIQSPGS